MNDLYRTDSVSGVVQALLINDVTQQVGDHDGCAQALVRAAQS